MRSNRDGVQCGKLWVALEGRIDRLYYRLKSRRAKIVFEETGIEITHGMTVRRDELL